MINPIQQNTSFRGNDVSLTGGGVAANSAQKTSVRADYNNAVSDVLNIQQKMMQAVDENSGKKLDTIA